MTTYQVQDYQTLLDLSVQLYGDAQYVVKLAQDNALTLDVMLNGSMSVVYDETLTALLDEASYLGVTRQFVATYTPAEDDLIEHSIQEHTAQEHN